MSDCIGEDLYRCYKVIDLKRVSYTLAPSFEDKFINSVSYGLIAVLISVFFAAADTEPGVDVAAVTAAVIANIPEYWLSRIRRLLVRPTLPVLFGLMALMTMSASARIVKDDVSSPMIHAEYLRTSSKVSL